MATNLQTTLPRMLCQLDEEKSWHWEARARELFLQLSLVVLCDTVNSRGCMSAPSFPQALKWPSLSFHSQCHPISTHTAELLTLKLTSTYNLFPEATNPTDSWVESHPQSTG